MKKQFQRVISILLTAIFLLTGVPVLVFDAMAEEASTESREFNYGSSAYGLYFYPVAAEDGTVSAKVHRTVASGYDNYYGVTEGDYDIELYTSPFGGTMLSVSDDGYLKAGSKTGDVMGFGFKWTGFFENTKAKFAVVRYRIIGKTLSESDGKSFVIGDSQNNWASDSTSATVLATNADEGWNLATLERTVTSGNMIADNHTVWVQFPRLNDKNASVVIDYIGFCADQDAVNATKAAIEKANAPVSSSTENRRYGTSAFGLYFKPIVAADGKVSAKAYRTLASGYDNYYSVTEGDIDIELFDVFSATTLGISDDGYLKVGSTSTGSNSMGFRFKWTGAFPNVRATQVVIRYRIVGKTLTAEDNKKISIGNASGWGGQNTASVPVTNENDGWNIATLERTATGNMFNDSTVWVQFPDLNNKNAYVVIDYIGFCADQNAANTTKAAIEAANSLEMVGVQVATDANSKSVRFVGKVKAESIEALNQVFDEIGFALTADDGNVYYAKITQVYKTIVAAGETLTAEDGEFFFTYVVKGIPSDDTVNFEATPYGCPSGSTEHLQSVTAVVGYNPTTNQLEKAKKN